MRTAALLVRSAAYHMIVVRVCSDLLVRPAVGFLQPRQYSGEAARERGCGRDQAVVSSLRVLGNPVRTSDLRGDVLRVTLFHCSSHEVWQS